MVNILALNTEDLKALTIYRDVLEHGLRFPKYFWTNEIKNPIDKRSNSRIITRYCLENLAGLEIQDFRKYNLKQIRNLLIKGKLFGMVQRVFNHDILEILRNSYPSHFKNRELKEWYWSKHGLWYNENFIKEAVQDMVRKEGIRWIGDIPGFDWKKRLLTHGIYNILAYFDWSVYSMFNFVYPDKFHPADFKYKIKWAASNSYQNAFYFMHKVFKKKGYTPSQILLLKTSDFRRHGLAGMLVSLFESSTIKAKEYYIYRTINDRRNQKELQSQIRTLLNQKSESKIKERLASAAKGKFIYNLHSNSTLYGYIKRYARKANKSIYDFISSYGFVYKSAKKDFANIDKEDIWKLRKQGFTYVQIAEKLGSNPTTITEMCKRHFGGDPLIPRPISDYVTVQELMNTYRVDHKTIMKIVYENNFENHATIRFRYLKKTEIFPALNEYVSTSKHHKYMINRYIGIN